MLNISKTIYIGEGPKLAIGNTIGNVVNEAVIIPAGNTQKELNKLSMLTHKFSIIKEILKIMGQIQARTGEIPTLDDALQELLENYKKSKKQIEKLNQIRRPIQFSKNRLIQIKTSIHIQTKK